MIWRKRIKNRSFTAKTALVLILIFIFPAPPPPARQLRSTDWAGLGWAGLGWAGLERTEW